MTKELVIAPDSMFYNKLSDKEGNILTQVFCFCTLEPQMGKCIWSWCEKYKGYLCSICGEELIKIERFSKEK